MPPQPQQQPGWTLGVQAPLTSNRAFRYQPYQPFTGFSPIQTGMGPTADAAANMVAQMFGSMVMPRYGMLALSAPDMGLYDRIERLRLQEMHDRFVQEAFQEDIPAMMRTFRGLSALAGTPWDAQTITAARNLARRVSSAGGMVLQLFGPEIVDALMGPSGSAGAMAHAMFQGGRFRIDPVTGMPGLSPETMRQVQREVFRELFGEGAQRAVGLGAGQLGALYTELARYGMLPSPARLQDINQDTLRQVAQDRGIIREGERLDLQRLSPEQVDRLRQAPEVAAALRSFDAARVTDTLEDYGRVLKAMREIFGDAGRPNAPIPELINTLNALTGGVLPQLQPQAVERMVRTTYNLARNAGLGLEGLMALTGGALQQVTALGLPPSMAGALVQESLAFRAAFMHQGMGAHRAWGRGNIDEVTMLNQQMAAGGQASPLANRIGMALRLEAGMRAARGEGFPENSAAAAFVRAVRAGSPTFRDPRTGQQRSIIMGEREFMEMIGRDTGLSQMQIFEMLEDRFNNMREFQAQGGTRMVRRAQAVELDRMLRGHMAFSVAGTLRTQGLDREAARGLAEAAADVAMEAFGDVDVYADDRRRTRVIAEGIRRRYEELARGQGSQAEAARQLLQRHGRDDGFWAALAEQQYSEVQEVAENNPWVRTTAANLLTLRDPTMIREAGVEMARETGRAMFQEAMAPMGRTGGFLRRGIEALQEADEDTSLTEVFLHAIGGEREDEIKRLLTGTRGDARQTEGILQRTQEARRAFEAANRRYQAAVQGGDDNEIAEARSDLESKAEGLRQSIQQVTEYLGRKGFRISDTISRQDVTNMRRDRKWVSEQLQHRTADEEKFRLGVAMERQNADELVERVLSDEQLMVRLGKGGLDKVEAMRDVTRRLDEMAVRYAGGSLADLLSGRLEEGLDPRERRRILNQAAAYREQQGELLEWFESNVEGATGFRFLEEGQERRLSEIAEKWAQSDQLRDQGLEIGTQEDLMRLSDPEFRWLQASRLWGELSKEDRELITQAREAYRAQRQRVRDYRRAYRDAPERVIERSIERLFGRDLSREEVKQMVGGEDVWRELTEDATIEGRRRRAGFEMMTRDIARYRKLQSKEKLTDKEQRELARLEREIAEYDPYFREMGLERGADVARDPDRKTFREAYGTVPSMGPPPPKEAGEPQESKIEMHVAELYIDGEPQGHAEGRGDAEVEPAGGRGM